MGKSRDVLLALAIGAVLAALAFLLMRERSPLPSPTSKSEEGIRRVPFDRNQDETWPNSYTFAWQVPIASHEERIGVCIRTVESKIPAGQYPKIGEPMKELPQPGPGVQDVGSGYIMPGESVREARVSCQMVNLRTIGLGREVVPQPLRWLVRLSLPGQDTAEIEGQRSILKGEEYVGMSLGDPQRFGQDVHLMTFHTRTGDTLYTHLLLLRPYAQP